MDSSVTVRVAPKLGIVIKTTSILIDVDECYEETDGCQQECVNTNGSYYCTCRIGYRLTSDGYNCEGTYGCYKLRDNKHT